jgi:hypothetical protein
MRPLTALLATLSFLSLSLIVSTAKAEDWAELPMVDTEGNRLAIRLNDIKNIQHYVKITWKFTHPKNSATEHPKAVETIETYYIDCQNETGKTLYYTVYDDKGAVLDEGFPLPPHDGWAHFEKTEPVFKLSCDASKSLN